MHNLTIIIPLLDRPEYTKIWLKENIIDGVYYIFADGSLYDNNYEIFKNIKNKYIKYIRYSQDKNIGDFIKKMSDVSNYVKTKYVMTSDNDDFLNITGINQCINYLDLNSDYGIASGTTLFVSEIRSKNKTKYKLSFNFASSINLNNLQGINGIEKFLDNTADKTNYIWYGVYRAEVFKTTWQEMLNSNIRDGQLNELLQTCMALGNNKYKYIYCNNYVRLINPTKSYAREFTQNLNIRFIDDKKAKLELENFINYFSKKFKIEKDVFKKIFFKCLKQSNKKLHTFNIFKLFYLKLIIYCYRLFNLFTYNIPTIIKFINIFYYFNRYLKIFR